ncbi:hypothetical protein EVAR_103913_1 [Eumeta japonica]|uniref:Uncharacterized protein n=1 Tax=Eumeta variegata TaxID=151549 RepID=A0A4C2A9W0_EUMVA|nr:hypothetical protein EVAR_103913_1 [Eumeta japonica]
MANIPHTHRVSDNAEFDANDKLKILGLHWLPANHVFTFSVDWQTRECTKGNILLTVARFWVLMGYVAPVIPLAKLFIKSLWENKIDWDDTPPASFMVRWQQFENELPLLRDVHLPRHTRVNAHSVTSCSVLQTLPKELMAESCTSTFIVQTITATGEENPADCLSRCGSPARSARSPPDEWSVSQFDRRTVTDLPESKTTTLMNIAVKPDPPLLYHTHSLYASHVAELAVIRALQIVYFSDEIRKIENNKLLALAFRKLNPFLHDGVLRVGGRLENTELCFDSRHPILLPL